MKTTTTTSRSVTISVVTQHSDGTEGFAAHHISPIDEAACQGVMRSIVATLFEAPIDEGSAPSRFVSAATPITKIECSLQVFEDSDTMRWPLYLSDPEFTLGYD